MIKKLSLYDPNISTIKENSFIECYCVIEDLAHNHEYTTESSDIFLDIESARNRFNEILNNNNTKDLIADFKEQAYKNNSMLIMRDEKESREYYIKDQYDTERYSIHIQRLYQRLTKKDIYKIHQQIEFEIFSNIIESLTRATIQTQELKRLYNEFKDALDSNESYNAIYTTTLFQILKNNNLITDNYEV